MEEQQVILVDNNDGILGVMGKMEAHQKGVLHRAFSIFIFNNKGEMLLQQRAADKYHSGGLWTNACCSHPRPGEETIAAAARRLKEELGFETPIVKVFDFVYRVELDNELTEHEFDHVFAGEYNGLVRFNTEEVKDICYRTFDEIRQSLESSPEKYTEWFRIAFPRIETWWAKRYGKSFKF